MIEGASLLREELLRQAVDEIGLKLVTAQQESSQISGYDVTREKLDRLLSSEGNYLNLALFFYSSYGFREHGGSVIIGFSEFHDYFTELLSINTIEALYFDFTEIGELHFILLKLFDSPFGFRQALADDFENTATGYIGADSWNGVVSGGILNAIVLQAKAFERFWSLFPFTALEKEHGDLFGEYFDSFGKINKISLCDVVLDLSLIRFRNDTFRLMCHYFTVLNETCERSLVEFRNFLSTPLGKGFQNFSRFSSPALDFLAFCCLRMDWDFLFFANLLYDVLIASLVVDGGMTFLDSPATGNLILVIARLVENFVDDTPLGWQVELARIS